MRRQRTIYFNDARHYYLFVLEPPMRLEDAWMPIDEVVGTGVDTFIYGVSRADGLFYPTLAGLRFGEDKHPFEWGNEWRVWENMQSLIDRGLDPLQVLVDRAHEKGMDFFASLRIGGYGGMNPGHALAQGGRGFVHPEMRRDQLAVVEEVATRYPVEGVELDFAAAPQGNPCWLSPEDAAAHTPTMTQFVRDAAEKVRRRPGQPGHVGARVYPTEELNLKLGLDVRTWLREGLVDFVVPVVYAHFVLDADMPFEWLVQAAHERDVSVYGMLQPLYRDESRRFYLRENATPSMLRAGAANFWEKGVDGLYAWFLSWPLGPEERGLLTELSDPGQMRERDKHYFLRRHSEESASHDYEVALPLELSAADMGNPAQIPFLIADDTSNDRLHSTVLKIAVFNLVSADRLEFALNGESLQGEMHRRRNIRQVDPYAGQWLEFQLEKVRPRKGRNLLEVTLCERPPGLEGSAIVEDVEILLHYDTPVQR